MSSTSSDTESISDWTLLDQEHDGDVESTDESSSTGSSLEIVTGEAIISNQPFNHSPSPSTGGAMFILRVSSREQGISESEDSDGSNPARGEKSEISVSDTIEDLASQVEGGQDENESETEKVLERGEIRGGTPTSASGEGENLSASVQSIEVIKDDSEEDIQIVAVETCTASPTDSGVDGRPELVGQLKANDESELVRAKEDESVMEVSHESLVESGFTFLEGADVFSGEVEQDDATRETTEQAVVKVPRKKLEIPVLIKVFQAIDLMGMVLLIFAIIITGAYIIPDSGYLVSNNPFRTYQHLKHCELHLQKCFEKKHKLSDDLLNIKDSHDYCKSEKPINFDKQAHERKLMEDILLETGHFDDSILDGLSFEEAFKMYMDIKQEERREMKDELEIKELENERYKNEVNELQVEIGDLRSVVSRLRYAVSSQVTQQEKEAVGIAEELHKKVTLLQLEKEGLRNELETLKIHAVQSPEDAELGGPVKEDEESTGLKLHLQKLTEDLETERAWSRYIYEQYREKKPERDWFGCLRLFMGNSTVQPGVFEFLGTKTLDMLNATTSFWEHMFGKPWSNVENGEADGPPTEGTGKTGEHHKHTLTDSMFDILNRTQISVLDISKQIQDTWNQVKNLSEDMWTKSEPTLKKLHQNLNHKLQKVSKRFRNKVNKKMRKWLQNSEKVVDKETTGQDTDDGNQDITGIYVDVPVVTVISPERPRNQKIFRKCNKSFKKLVREIRGRNREDFEELSAENIEYILNKFETFEVRFRKYTSVQSGNWFDCQYDWWKNIATGGKPRVAKICYIYLKGWQLQLSKRIKWRKWKRVSWDFLEHPCLQPSTEHFSEETLDTEGTFREELVRDEAINPHVTYEWVDSFFDSDDADTKGADSTENDGDFSSSDRENLTEKVVQDKCGPNHEKDESESWYTKMTEGRKLIRNSKADESLEGDHKADWLFERADEREFERSRPDDWFFRRNEKFEQNKKKGLPVDDLS